MKNKNFSYQGLDGISYIEKKKFSLKRKNFSIYQQKEFISKGLTIAAKIERGKRNLQNKVEDIFGVGKIIDPKTGKPVVQDARKRRLIAEGVTPQMPEMSQPKATEIGKDGKINVGGVVRRLKRKAAPVIGKGINAGIDLVDSITYPTVGMIHTPGRTLSKGIEKTIENPVAAATYGVSYAAPFMGTVGKAIMVADNLVPNPLQYKAINAATPKAARTWLKKKSIQFKEGVGKNINSFQWTDTPKVVKKGVAAVTAPISNNKAS